MRAAPLNFNPNLSNYLFSEAVWARQVGSKKPKKELAASINLG